MKKTIFFMLCLAPVGAWAEPFTGGLVTNTTFEDGIDVSAMYIGTTVEDNSALFTGPDINQENYTLTTKGDISVDGLLSIADGYVLNLQNSLGTTYNATFDSIDANGYLSMRDVGTLNVTNGISADNGLVIQGTPSTTGQEDGAESMTVGGMVAVSGGNTVLDVSGPLSMGGFSNTGTGTTNINGTESITVTGSIENSDRAGNMIIKTEGALNAGNISNSNSEMNISAGDITVSGTMKNDADFGTDHSGKMVIVADNLTVQGGNSANPSFVSGGDLRINVSGATVFEHGIDISAMADGNQFELITGTLDLGTDNADDWIAVFQNRLNSFDLRVTADTLEINSAIVNGLTSGVSYNADANMNIKAQALVVGDSVRGGGSVTNHGGILNIESTLSSGAGIVINGGISSDNVAVDTQVDSASTLAVNGSVSNSAGTMSVTADGALTIGSRNFSNSGSVSNSGERLEILSTTSDGVITITQNVTNESGQLELNAYAINVGGVLTANGGELNVQGSSTGQDVLPYMTIGAIDVNGGELNLNALSGGVTVSGGVDVSGGVMNIDTATHKLAAGASVNIAGNVNVAGDSTADGDVNVAAYGNQGFVLSAFNSAGGTDNASIHIGGNIVNTSLSGRSITFDAATIFVDQGVKLSGTNNAIAFGATGTDYLSVSGAVEVENGATLNLTVDDADLGSLFVDDSSVLLANGTQITTDKELHLAGNLWFDGLAPSPKPVSGTVVGSGVNNLTLKSNDAQVVVGGSIDLGDKTLNLEAPRGAVIVDGGVQVQSGGTFLADGVTVQVGDVANSGTITFESDKTVAMGNAVVNAGTMNVKANGTTTMNGMTIAEGAVVNIDAVSVADVIASGDVVVNGDIAQGTTGQTGTLNLLASDVDFSANSLNVTGDYIVNDGNGVWTVTNSARFGGNISLDDGTSLRLVAGGVSANMLNNGGNLQIVAQNGINVKSVANSGNLLLDSGSGYTTVDTFDVGGVGVITLAGAGLNANDGTFTTQNRPLYQNFDGQLVNGDVNVASDSYEIFATAFDVAGIDQVSGSMIVNASDINVSGDIDALDLRFVNNPEDSWIVANIDGSVSGGVDFMGLKRLDITGNYTINNNSDLWAAILPYGDGEGNTSAQNYWASVEITEDNKVGEITNPNPENGGGALITVGKKLNSVISGVAGGSATIAPDFGITLFEIVDQGSAIWLLHAEDGLATAEGFESLRNLDIKFCNADGSICVPYLAVSNEYNMSNPRKELPAYITERDTDGDGLADSLYVVFDPQFGGPIQVFDPEDVVAGVEDVTDGEISASDALDKLVQGQMMNTGFSPNSPIEIIPAIFEGTNFEEMANELYDRMEYYQMTGHGEPLARFSRLFQPRELEQVVGSITLNEHTNFRSFEDRMFDEFIWNRNRDLKKAWLDVEYGMFSQDVSDDKRVKGDRFRVSGGFDWQQSETLIVGVTGHVSNTNGDNSDVVELGYRPGESVRGTVGLDVDDLNIGVGGYMMKTFGEKTRLYGNAFLDVHMLDISRDQTFVDHIDGSGTAFSVISEWGLLHDWLNEYVVGNMYARVGYNFGFDITEHAGGQDYMDMQSDGYLILTPGYSLTAQKRIYPSAWFQIRPYASAGIEYDVLGAPDFVKYKFAPAHQYTKYNVDVDPLWANIGGGVEFLSANGLQFGIDYRYQYNQVIQLHNIKVSGSYRF